MMGEESKLLGVSVRGWIVIMLVASVCCLAFLQIEVKEPLYTMVTVAVGYYFGQKREQLKHHNNKEVQNGL